MDAIVVGIDVSKNQLDVHVGGRDESFFVARDAEGFAALIERLRPIALSAVGLEATGGFEIFVAARLACAGRPTVVVNPAQARAFANALGKRAKTDPTDAAVIAHFFKATAPEIRPLRAEEMQLLADVVARRRQIVAMIVAERQRERTARARMKKSIDGQWRGKSFIGGGSSGSNVRAALFMGAMVARASIPFSRPSATNSSPPENQSSSR